MNKNNSKSALTTLSIAMLLVACNGNDHDAPASTTTVPTNTTTLKTLTITPSLGKILKANTSDRFKKDLQEISSLIENVVSTKHT